MTVSDAVGTAMGQTRCDEVDPGEVGPVVPPRYYASFGPGASRSWGVPVPEGLAAGGQSGSFPSSASGRACLMAVGPKRFVELGGAVRPAFRPEGGETCPRRF